MSACPGRRAATEVLVPRYVDPHLARITVGAVASVTRVRTPEAVRQAWPAGATTKRPVTPSGRAPVTRS